MDIRPSVFSRFKFFSTCSKSVYVLHRLQQVDTSTAFFFCEIPPHVQYHAHGNDQQHALAADTATTTTTTTKYCYNTKSILKLLLLLLVTLYCRPAAASHSTTVHARRCAQRRARTRGGRKRRRRRAWRRESLHSSKYECNRVRALRPEELVQLQD